MYKYILLQIYYLISVVMVRYNYKKHIQCNFFNDAISLLVSLMLLKLYLKKEG